MNDRDALARAIDDYTDIAVKMGLVVPEIEFEVVTPEQLYEIASYHFAARFPHWSHGSDYFRQKTMFDRGVSKIMELVVNTDPPLAYLLSTNSLVTNKLVVAHVIGHCDFFSRNIWFRDTNRQMDRSARAHAEMVEELEREHGVEAVERVLDAALSIALHVDPSDIRRKSDDEQERERLHPAEAPRGQYDDLLHLTGTRERPKVQARKIPAEPDRDLLGFIAEHGRYLEQWERDLLQIVREEYIYLHANVRTKTVNEGWACATGESLVLTESGFIRFKDLYDRRHSIATATGEVGQVREITDFHKEESVPTLRIHTKRGYTIEGAYKHRVKKESGEWVYLRDIQVGDRLAMAHGTNIWPLDLIPLSFTPKATTVTMHTIAGEIGKTLSATWQQVYRGSDKWSTALRDAIARHGYVVGGRGRVRKWRQQLTIPPAFNDDMAYFLGYFVGNGCRAGAGICIVCGDEEQSHRVARLIHDVTGLSPSEVANQKGTSWRVSAYSLNLLQLLENMGVDLGLKSMHKVVPDMVLRSPRHVVSAFLRGYFDADGHIDPVTGVSASSASHELLKVIQTLLLNYNIVSTFFVRSDGIARLDVRGLSAARFRDVIGFALTRKKTALDTYIDGHGWFRAEDIAEKVISIETGTADVYDITVDDAHTYVANGFINHNSFWHEKIIEAADLTPDEHIEFRLLHTGVISSSPRYGINPYAVGYRIWRDIERRWNEGAVETTWYGEERRLPSGQGMAKVLEVAAEYRDSDFVRTFLTERLVEELDLYSFAPERKSAAVDWVVGSQDWRAVRDLLARELEGHGVPAIEVVNGDHRGQGALLLRHDHESDGRELDWGYCKRVMQHLYGLWRRPILILAQGELGDMVGVWDESGWDRVKA